MQRANFRNGTVHRRNRQIRVLGFQSLGQTRGVYVRSPDKDSGRLCKALDHADGRGQEEVGVMSVQSQRGREG